MRSSRTCFGAGTARRPRPPCGAVSTREYGRADGNAHRWAHPIRPAGRATRACVRACVRRGTPRRLPAWAQAQQALTNHFGSCFSAAHYSPLAPRFFQALSRVCVCVFVWVCARARARWRVRAGHQVVEQVLEAAAASKATQPGSRRRAATRRALRCVATRCAALQNRCAELQKHCVVATQCVATRRVVTQRVVSRRVATRCVATRGAVSRRRRVTDFGSVDVSLRTAPGSTSPVHASCRHGQGGGDVGGVRLVPAQMCKAWAPSSADMGGMSPIPVQLWEGWAQSR
jgi:hypothetical protein